MKNHIKNAFNAALICAITFLSTTAFAGKRDYYDIEFVNFPAGTKCNAQTSNGRVKIKKTTREIRVKVKGYPETATFFCKLPDGQQVVLDFPAKLPAEAKTISGEVYTNGTAVMFADIGGIVRLNLTNVLR